MADEKVGVKFIRSVDNYVVGDRAGFSEGVAKRLVDNKFAEYVETKKTPKPKPPKPPEG